MSPSGSVVSAGQSAPAAPVKPKRYTEQELNNLIRAQLGFDKLNIFKDEEFSQEGMKKALGLTS